MQCCVSPLGDSCGWRGRGGLRGPSGYTNEFREFMALIGDGASELSWPPAVSLLALFPLYWPINEPSSLNWPSPPSP
ncbi:hypothetical protein EYF80_018028 [Liparis tanakae]|uniref:Uncharacterized protein n=1 Tax=Liparis tanakae TaxID=230148 RepID=A0A4Z2I143_9TELE|nr:hypothetical protein EYF80_018028 [Liparis tanakae]